MVLGCWVDYCAQTASKLDGIVAKRGTKLAQGHFVPDCLPIEVILARKIGPFRSGKIDVMSPRLFDK
jgi:hypothetical protein